MSGHDRDTAANWSMNTKGTTYATLALADEVQTANMIAFAQLRVALGQAVPDWECDAIARRLP